MSASTVGSSVAGPKVATILVRLGLSSCGALLENLNRGKLLAFDEFQESAAAGGYVRNAVFDAVFLDGRQGIAAARQRKRLAAGNGGGQRARALAELSEFEYAHRAIPQYRSGRAHQRGDRFG